MNATALATSHRSASSISPPDAVIAPVGGGGLARNAPIGFEKDYGHVL